MCLVDVKTSDPPSPRSSSASWRLTGFLAVTASLPSQKFRSPSGLASPIFQMTCEKTGYPDRKKMLQNNGTPHASHATYETYARCLLTSKHKALPFKIRGRHLAEENAISNSKRDFYFVVRKVAARGAVHDQNKNNVGKKKMKSALFRMHVLILAHQMAHQIVVCDLATRW